MHSPPANYCQICQKSVYITHLMLCVECGSDNISLSYSSALNYEASYFDVVAIIRDLLDTSDIAEANINSQNRNNEILEDYRNYLSDGDFGEYLLQLQSCRPPITENPCKNIYRIPIKKFNEKGRCSICMSDYLQDETGYLISCNHRFHKECLKGWMKIKNTCPNCRTPIVFNVQK